MPRHSTVNVITDIPRLDAKARRKLEDQRRMAFRRAIERYNEERLLDHETHELPDLLAVGQLRSPRSGMRCQPGA